MEIALPPSTIRCIGIAALAILTSWTAHGEIKVVQRHTSTFSVSREADVIDNPAPQSGSGLEPIDLSVSSAVGSSRGTVHVTSQITHDLETGVFEVSGTGTTTAQTSAAGANGSFSGVSQQNGNVIGLFFEITGDVSYNYILTENLTATHTTPQQVHQDNDGPTVVFRDPPGNVIVFDLLPPVGSREFSKSGILKPGGGVYSLSVVVQNVVAGTDGTNHAASASASFNLKLTPVGPATEVRWVNGAGGSFQTATNWDPQTVPGSKQTAIFEQASAYTVEVGSATTDRLQFSNGNVTFANSAYTVSSSSENPPGLTFGSSVFTLASGQLNSVAASIASNVTIGADAVWSNASSLRIAGFLTIAARGTVLSGNTQIGAGAGAGNVLVDGQGAEWRAEKVTIGRTSEGTLSIKAGAKVLSHDAIVGAVANGTVNIQGTGSNRDRSTWNLDVGDLLIGESGTGTVTVTDGGFLSIGSLVINQGSSLTLRGVAAGAIPFQSKLKSFGDTTMDGTLLIEQGAFSDHSEKNVKIGSASPGNVTVRGFDAASENSSSAEGIKDLIAGAGQQGTLTIEDGAYVLSENGTIAAGPGVGGDVVVRGTSNSERSTWELSKSLIVGDLNGGTGTLEIKDGGVVVTRGPQAVNVGNDGSVGIISVTGRSNLGPATLSVAGNLTIGFFVDARGRLTVSEGGFVEVLGGMVADRSSGLSLIPTVAVGGADPATGAGSAINVAGELIVGVLSQLARVAIAEDGKVSCQDAILGGLSDGFGSVDVGASGPGAAARFEVRNDLFVGDAGRGELTLRNGGIVKVGGALTIAARSAVLGNGTLSAPDRTVTNAGMIAPGLSAGTLEIDGNYVQTSEGTLAMEIGGVGEGQSDILHVTGTSALDGKLEVRFINNFLPAKGQQFNLLRLDGAVTGSFAQIIFPNLMPGFEFSTATVGNTLQFTALNDGVPVRAKGIFRGVLQGDPPGHDTAGIFTVQVNGRGGFTTRFVLGGHSFATRGKFDPSGKFSKTIPRKGDSPLTLNLELDTSGTVPMIRGTLGDGTQSINISLNAPNAFNPKENPAPQAGKYTVLLQFAPLANDAPQANGIGTVAISKAGAVRMVGALPDGTRISQGTVLSTSGECPVYVTLYKKEGGLFGALQFREKAGTDFDGALHWSRPETPDDEIQTAGFLATLSAIGSRYVASLALQPLLDLPNGATVTLSDADLTPALTKNLTFTAPRTFIVINPGSDNLSLRVKSATGLLSGRFIHSATGRSTKVQGVLFQKQNFGSGFFLRPGKTGSFALEAIP